VAHRFGFNYRGDAGGREVAGDQEHLALQACLPAVTVIYSLAVQPIGS
jgi:hypothetical protein